jgi:hybrid polyketide synthase/nonribosomal peptide synthetase ACE1
MPFVFSAASKTSLSSYLASFCDYLRDNESKINLRDLAMTLDSRRSRLPFATTIAATTAKRLREKIEEKLRRSETETEQPIGIRTSFQGSKDQKPQILGVFTGQGAQYARMGAALIESSDTARRIIEKLEARLAQLPKNKRPSWSLKQELLKTDSTRASQSALSQPLCTAVQILQVELLRAAGIEFTAVVGHSSGEIGAAYSTGLISAEDAICIAYHRGLHTDLAHGCDGQLGAMIAAETSSEDAQDLCNEAQFQGRVSLAAVNSPISVTLSGDEDAIEEMKIVFEDEHKFVRRLKVDKAYHSHHMVPCSAADLQSLNALDIQIDEGANGHWFSSVDGGKLIDSNDVSRLKAAYCKLKVPLLLA